MTDRTFKYVMCPADATRRKWYRKLEPRFSHLLRKWFDLVILAQDARSEGRILLGGKPMDAEDVAFALEARPTPETINDWDNLLRALTDEGVLRQHESGGLQVVEPREWYRPPSREPQVESSRKRAARARASADVRTCPEASADVRTCPEDAADVRSLPLSSDLSGPNPNPNPNVNPNPNQPPTPAGGNGAARVEFPTLASQVLEELLPGILSPQESQAIARMTAVGHELRVRLDRALDALRKACTEVGYEMGIPGNNIRYPRRIALERAITDIRDNPMGPPRSPWDNTELPEYARLNAERSATR